MMICKFEKDVVLPFLPESGLHCKTCLLLYSDMLDMRHAVDNVSKNHPKSNNKRNEQILTAPLRLVKDTN